MANRSYADWILDNQERLGWGNEETARRAGTSPTTISNIISGKIVKPHYRTMRRIAHAFEVEVPENGQKKALARPSGSPAAQSPGVQVEAEINTFLDKMSKQRDLQRQAINRADESRGWQEGSRDPVNEVNARLRELPEEVKDEIVIRLVEEVLSLQDENTALREEVKERV